jgi:hypothetical protein
MSSLVSKTQDVSCVSGISILHVITDLFKNVKSRSVITCCIEIPETQDTSCALETRLDIHEQVSYYMFYGDTSNMTYLVLLVSL